MELTDRWKDKLTNFMKNLRKAESNQSETIKSVNANFVKWQDKSRSVKKMFFFLCICMILIDVYWLSHGSLGTLI